MAAAPLGNKALLSARARASGYEDSIKKTQRKQLGQFFTGLPLARLLAALSLEDSCLTVIDPMVGHGDLLDAIIEVARCRNIKLKQVDGIEIDKKTANVCKERLAPWNKIQKDLNVKIVNCNAFNLDLMANLSHKGYDLVITNPPYVRYQTLSENGENSECSMAEQIRASLQQIAQELAPKAEKTIWMSLIKSYSGFADLSVPSWFLSGLLVRPGGMLALVVPATWRTRDYASVLRYLTCRCFDLQTVVADTQPGWFSKALVRTNLVIAKRRKPKAAASKLAQRKARNLYTQWVEIYPKAKKGDSLVGNVFDNPEPEIQLANLLQTPKKQDLNIRSRGISEKKAAVKEEIASLIAVFGRSSWFGELGVTAGNGI